MVKERAAKKTVIKTANKARKKRMRMPRDLHEVEVLIEKIAEEQVAIKKLRLNLKKATDKNTFKKTTVEINCHTQRKLALFKRIFKFATCMRSILTENHRRNHVNLPIGKMIWFSVSRKSTMTRGGKKIDLTCTIEKFKLVIEPSEITDTRIEIVYRTRSN